MTILFFKKYWIWCAVLVQAILLYLLIVGVASPGVIWVVFGLLAVAMLALPSHVGLKLFLVHIPFYLVLPQQYSDTLSMWRPLAALLFLRMLAEYVSTYAYAYVQTLVPIRLSIFFGIPKKMGNTWRGLLWWERIAVGLFGWGVVSLLWAQFFGEGVKQLLFLLNAALVYPVVLWVLRDRSRIVELLRAGAASTGIIILLGFVQYGITLFVTAYYFWQFWALQVASLYYGTTLARVLQYSNSWVTVQGEEKVLRMFSIMPSSHAFAMVCVLFLAFVLPLLFVSPYNEKMTAVKNALSFVSVRRSLGVWVGVALAMLALILSGTRGVWAGMLPAVAVAGLLYWRSRVRHVIAPVLAAMLLVLVLFEASPLIDRTAAWVRHGGFGQGTLDRVVSIIDTDETSNAGRLDMWKRAARQIVKNPVGVGHGNFITTIASGDNYDSAANQDNQEYNLPQRYVTAHSLYLQLLVELGVVGFLLFCGFWLAWFWDAYKALYSARLPELEAVLLATAGVMFVWFLAYGIFDLTWLNDKILLYTFLLLGLIRVTSSSSVEAKPGVGQISN
ncbi:MAG: O-antigen ligase family protein [Candidatus Doudnabacteria bacterium]|nr:O-antigen ligase family protein [Candidatus Doudnabacteria bacterium]